MYNYKADKNNYFFADALPVLVLILRAKKTLLVIENKLALIESYYRNYFKREGYFCCI